MDKNPGRRLSITVVALVAVALVALIAGASVIVSASSQDAIAPGVTVAGVSIGQQNDEDAQATLQRELWPKVATARFEAPAGDKTLIVALDDLGISLDSAATVARAHEAGGVHLLGVRLPAGGGGEVKPVYTLDAAKLDDAAAKLRKAVDTPARNARLTVREGWGVVVVPSRDGSTVDVNALVGLLMNEAGEGRAYSGRIPMRTAAAAVSTETAKARAREAAHYFSRSITLRHASRRIVLAPTDIAGMVSVNTGPDAERYPVTFRNEQAERVLHRLFRWAERPAVNAGIIVHKKGGMTITEASDGEAIDMAYLLEDLDEAAAGRGDRTIVVSTSPVLPRLTAEDIRSKGLSSLGSQFRTYFDSGNQARARNIALAAKLVDGTRIEPGEVFSLNAAMGPRTVNRGFDYAPVIAADNVLRQGVGGGICQYATTLFNAALLAGLPIVDREAHSLYIAHYPVGRDATVAWGSIDFRFRNDTNRTLVIRSWTQGDALTVALVGKTGRTVTLKTGPFYDIRTPQYTRSSPRVIYDDDLGPGVVRWEKGVAGRSVKVERVVKNARGDILARDSFVSRYAPLDWVKRVGTS